MELTNEELHAIVRTVLAEHDENPYESDEAINADIDRLIRIETARKAKNQ